MKIDPARYWCNDLWDDSTFFSAMQSYVWVLDFTFNYIRSNTDILYDGK